MAAGTSGSLFYVCVGYPIHYLDGDLQGRGYLLRFGKTKAILVEHETGLEILYIAGSIASLAALVPLIMQGWGALHGRYRRRGAPIGEAVEIRRVDQDGHLREEHLNSQELIGLSLPLGVPNPVTITVSELLNNEMKAAAEQIKVLTARVESLEKQLQERNRRAPKSKVNRSHTRKGEKSGEGRSAPEI